MIENKLANFIKLIPLSLILFVFSFGALAAFIDSADTNAFLLQQLGIESIVERGHVYLEGSETPLFQLNIPLNSTVQPQGDFLLYKGHVYAAKQPGQFLIGSLVYFFLHRFGLTYKTDLTLTGGLVTLLTSALMTATMIVLIMEIVFVITRTLSISILIALFFGFGTPIFPYSGVTHHDIYGTFFSVLALFFLFYNHRKKETPNRLAILFSGLCAGFALFSSMLQVANTFVLTLYVLAQKRVNNVLLFGLGGLTGIMPMLLFNWMVFDHPLHFYNTVGNFPDVTPMFATRNILHKLDFYLLSPASSIGFYSPIFVVSLLGFALFPRKSYLPERIILPLSIMLLLVWLSTLQTVGGCQYGPRYLLPAMPFISIGLVGFFVGGQQKNYFGKLLDTDYIRIIIIVVGMASIIINMIGSIMGVMHCQIEDNAFKSAVNRILVGDVPQRFAFGFFGTGLVLVSFVAYYLKFSKKYRGATTELWPLSRSKPN